MEKQILLLLMLCGTLCKAQTSASVRLIDSALTLYANDNFSGVVLVAKGRQVLYEKAFGKADREKHIPNTTVTKFNIASLGKTFTATIIMKLVQQGSIELNQPIATYLPEYKIPNGNVITVHHLLTHTSRLSNYMLHPDYPKIKNKYNNLDSVMKLVVSMPLSFNTPGETFRYSNSGFIVLGKLIEKVTGKTYSYNLENYIFKPMEIQSNFSQRVYAAPRTAVPYFLVSADRFTNEKDEESGYPYSDGGLQLSAKEIYKFALGICANKLLDTSTRSTMWQPHVKAGRGAYGYGWMLSEGVNGKKFVGHTGGTLAFTAELRMNVEDEYIVVLLSNIPANNNRMINGIMSVLYTGKNDWLPKKPLANLMFEIIDQKGIDYLKENLDSIMKKGAYPALKNAGPMIPASEMLTKFKLYDKALQLLQYAAEVFPTDAAPFNGMGDTYKAMGNKPKAIESFQKTLSLNPKDEYAINQLKQLQQ